MERIPRRSLAFAAASLGALLLPRPAQATLMRGLPLRDLVARSQHVLLLTALDSRCLAWAIAGQRMIITETRVRVDEIVAKATPGDSELVLRTLGGQLDGKGELVHGQAELRRGTPCLTFLTRAGDGSLWVTGMAEGHYPIDADSGTQRLSASPHLPEIRDWEASAVHALVGQTVSAARSLVLKANQP